MRIRKHASLFYTLAIVMMFGDNTVYAKSNIILQNSNVQNSTPRQAETIEIRKYSLDTEPDMEGDALKNSVDRMSEDEEAEEISEIELPGNEKWGYVNMGIANVDNHLNVREEPSEKGKLIGKLPKNGACEIINIENGWAQIKSGKVEGYCSVEYLLTGQDATKRAMEIAALTAVINTDKLKVREEPNTDSTVLTLVSMGEKFEVKEVTDDGWIKFNLDNEDAYVLGDYVNVEESLDTAITISELLYGYGVSDVRVDLVQYAKQFVGNPYVWGGTSLTKGADCSGFTLSIYKRYGITLPHHAASQAKMGRKVSISEALPGDLIFYAKDGEINHVGIYIGGGQVVHASSPTTGIKISKVGYRSVAAVRRFLPD